VSSHGRKTLFDKVVELDPGGLDVNVASNYQSSAPLRIAVLPFTDRGSANYVVDKIPLTFRDQQQRARWAWTDAQRLRRSMVGYLSGREFYVLNPIGIDAVLGARGITDESQTRKSNTAEARFMARRRRRSVRRGPPLRVLLPGAGVRLAGGCAGPDGIDAHRRATD
jgi:hypothetical protein